MFAFSSWRILGIIYTTPSLAASGPTALQREWSASRGTEFGSKWLPPTHDLWHKLVKHPSEQNGLGVTKKPKHNSSMSAHNKMQHVQNRSDSKLPYSIRIEEANTLTLLPPKELMICPLPMVVDLPVPQQASRCRGLYDIFGYILVLWQYVV